MAPAAELASWAGQRLRALGHGLIGVPARPEVAVVGLDGLSAAEAAAAWAARIADVVHAVTVLPDQDAVFREAPVSREQARREAEQIRGRAQSSLERLQEAYPAVRFEATQVEGEPRVELLAAVDDVEAGMVAVGARNRASTSRGATGRVGRRVLDRSPVPVLVAREDPHGGPIVAAVGENPASGVAAAWGAGLAAWLERELVLVHATTGEGPEGFAEEGGLGRARTVPWPVRRGLAAVDEELEPGLFVLGSGAPRAAGSTAASLTETVECSAFVARERAAAGR